VGWQIAVCQSFKIRQKKRGNSEEKKKREQGPPDQLAKGQKSPPEANDSLGEVLKLSKKQQRGEEGKKKNDWTPFQGGDHRRMVAPETKEKGAVTSEKNPSGGLPIAATHKIHVQPKKSKPRGKLTPEIAISQEKHPGKERGNGQGDYIVL